MKISTRFSLTNLLLIFCLFIFGGLQSYSQCSITDISSNNESICNENGTPTVTTDDTFTADITVIFSDAPTTGTLDLTGDGTASVSVSGLTSPHTFVGVTLPANGSDISFTATFSDDVACTFTNNTVTTAPSNCSTDPCDAFASGNVDTDGDGVSDVCDTDDDNDGILDINDGCSPSNDIDISGNFGINNFLTDAFDGTYPFVGGTLDFDITELGSTSITTANPAVGNSQGPLFDFRGSNGDVGIIQLDFSPNINGGKFKLTDFDNNEVVTIEVFDGTIPVDLTVGTRVTVGTQIAQSGVNGEIFTTIVNSGVNGDAISQDNLGSVVFDLYGVSVTRIVVTVQLNSTPGIEGIRFTEVKEFCIDSDSDSIFDNVDLDSDNDGCFDALEGDGGLLTGQVDGIGVVLGGQDSNGVPSVVSGGQNDVSSINPLITGPQCDDDNDGVLNLNDICPGFDDAADNDADGFSDGCDLDDDNDGILDTFEGCSPSNNIDITGNLGANFLSDGNDGTYPIISGTFDLDITEMGGMSIITANPGISNSQGPLFDFRGSNGDTGIIQLDFSPNIGGGMFKLTDFDNNEVVTVEVFDGVTPVDLAFGLRAIVGSQITQSGSNGEVFTTTINSGVNGEATSEDGLGSVLFDLNGISVTRIVVTVQLNSSPGLSAIRFTEINSFCIDTDGDSVFDYFDLDSDNDGIYDVDEAGNGALDTNGDGIIDGSDTSFADGNNNGADDNTEVTTPVDTGGDSSFDFQNTDSDGDSCPDSNEAYWNPFAAGSDDGQFGESDPALVDVNGLVTETGADYSVGTNSAVVDALDTSGCIVTPSIATVKDFADIDGGALTEYDTVGQVINYTITLTNDGNVTVYNPTMADATADGSPARGADAPGNNDGVLDVGETWTYTASHTVTQADLDLGFYTNTAEGDGSADTDGDATGDTPVSSDESETVNANQTPSIEAVKTVAISNDVAPAGVSLGDELTYTITVENTGNVTLSNVMLTDTFLDANGNPLTLTGPAFVSADLGSAEGMIQVGETATYTATHIVTQSDIDSGGLSNSVIADANSPMGTDVSDTSDDDDDTDGNTEDDPTETVIVQNPSISLIKTTLPLDDTNGDGIEGSIDDIITYVFEVENTGNVTLTNIDVQDVLPGLNLVGGPIPVLIPGQVDNTTFTATYQITQSDLDTGFVTNSATVTSEGPDGDLLDPSDDVVDISDDPNDMNNNDNNGNGNPDDPTVTEVNSIYDLEVGKVVDPVDQVVVGDEITFTIEIANIGNVTATDIIISEQIPSGYVFISALTTAGIYSDVSGEWSITQLDPDQVEILQITVEVLGIGDYVNTAFVQSSVGGIDVNINNDESSASVDPICLTIYNEFSPNGDGVNETFVIDCLERFPNNKLEVYNRWGNLVYSKEGYLNDWDGTSNGRSIINESDKLPVGTYYYVLDLSNGSEPRVGWLYINR